MPPEERFVCRFVAEPPQELLAYGRWAETLSGHFLLAIGEIEAEEDLGEPGPLNWFPDRTWHGRTFIPVTSHTTTGLELYGYVSFRPGREGEGPDDFDSIADYTDVTAASNPHWRMDLCDEVVGTWRGEEGNVADMTLIWGRPMVPNGMIVTAELADLVVDQCTLVEERFTLLGPDSYRRDSIDVKLFDKSWKEIASESLYEEGGEDEDDEDLEDDELDAEHGELEEDQDDEEEKNEAGAPPPGVT